MLGSQTRGGRMEGADKSTELWRHPKGFFEVPKAFHDLISYTRETKSVKLQSRRIDPTPSSNILKKKDSVCSIHTHTEKECVCVWKRMKEGERERERGSERLRVLRVQFERKTFLLSRERTVGHEGNNKWWLKDLMRKGGREREGGQVRERERERERERTSKGVRWALICWPCNGRIKVRFSFIDDGIQIEKCFPPVLEWYRTQLDFLFDPLTTKILCDSFCKFIDVLLIE